MGYGQGRNSQTPKDPNRSGLAARPPPTSGPAGSSNGTMYATPAGQLPSQPWYSTGTSAELGSKLSSSGAFAEYAKRQQSLGARPGAQTPLASANKAPPSAFGNLQDIGAQNLGGFLTGPGSNSLPPPSPFQQLDGEQPYQARAMTALPPIPTNAAQFGRPRTQPVAGAVTPGQFGQGGGYTGGMSGALGNISDAANAATGQASAAGSAFETDPMYTQQPRDEGGVSPEDVPAQEDQLPGDVVKAVQGGETLEESGKPPGWSDVEGFYNDLMDQSDKDWEKSQEYLQNEMGAYQRRADLMNARMGRGIAGGYAQLTGAAMAQGMETYGKAALEHNAQRRQSQLGFLDRMIGEMNTQRGREWSLEDQATQRDLELWKSILESDIPYDEAAFDELISSMGLQDNNAASNQSESTSQAATLLKTLTSKYGMMSASGQQPTESDIQSALGMWYAEDPNRAAPTAKDLMELLTTMGFKAISAA